MEPGGQEALDEIAYALFEHFLSMIIYICSIEKSMRKRHPCSDLSRKRLRLRIYLRKYTPGSAISFQK